MSDEVLISGGGVAACCCASLLSKAGWRVVIDHEIRRQSPMLMLSEQTQLLLRDVFGGDSFLQGSTKIGKRVVAWSQTAEPVTLPHSALVMSETLLLDQLWSTLNVYPASSAASTEWRIHCSKRSLPTVFQHEFGTRTAFTYSVVLSENAESETCWVEATSTGWLFLIPGGDNGGSLISVGGDPEYPLARSRLVAQQVADLGASSGSFPAFPRIGMPLCSESRWIACGTAAISFDPIAGEGAGHSVREGILASAVIRAFSNFGLDNDLLSHYSSRMLSGFLRHLQETSKFYASFPGHWWQKETEHLTRGIEWTEQELASYPKSRFRLNGFTLEAF